MKRENTIVVIVFLLIMTFFTNRTYSQGVVEYGFKSNGKEIRQDQPLILSFYKNTAVLNPESSGQEEFINYDEKAVFTSLELEGAKYTNKVGFDSLEEVRLMDETDTILGIPVRKAETTLFSNSIEIWFTDDLSIKGSPDLQIAPYLGLVLKIVRNGNYEIYAKKIDKGTPPKNLRKQPDLGEMVDEAGLRALQIRSRYTTIPVFDKEIINFGDSIDNPEFSLADTVYRFAEGTVIAKKVKLPEDFNGNIFASLTQSSKGDAYDRTGSVFVIPTDKSISFLDALEKGADKLPYITDKNGDTYPGMTATEDFDPPVELIRFYTPFGVGAFNNKREIKGYNWEETVTYKQDVTELLPLLQGEVWIAAYIGNYDKNGHEVSLDLNFYPGRSSSKKETKPFVQPVFNTLNSMEMAGQTYASFFNTDSLEVRSYIPEGVTNLQLKYISTGHGGWGGGDEFNPKINTIYVDGKEVYSFIPWRTDCSTYRLSNPSSGNFPNGLSSSDLSRSGWCPGTTTNAVYIPLPDLKPGWHTFKVAIPQGEAEGNSMSFWNISGVLTGKIIE